MDKGTRNASRFKNALPSFLEKEEDCLDKNILVTLLELAPKTQDSQVYKCHNVAPLGPKSRKALYGEGQRGEEDKKDKRGRENGKDERVGRGHHRNKVNPMVGESSGSEASVYHHIIYQYYQRLIVL